MADNSSTFPKALKAPSTDNTLISQIQMQECVQASRKSPRKRIILPLHKSDNANLHRMLNAIQPGSYIQPHRHLFPPKPESVIVLQGAIYVFIFYPEGEVKEIYTVEAGGINLGIDSEPGVFHTFMAIQKDTVLFEVKPGPYNQADDKDFAPWAPAEGDHGAVDYLERLFKTAINWSQL